MKIASVEMNIHHIGYLVKRLKKAQAQFEILGYKLTHPTVHDSYREVDICFLEKDGYVVELISPTSPDSVVASLIKQYRNMPYHLCYSVADFEEALVSLTASGFAQMGVSAPAPAIEGRRVVFLMSSAIGIIELLEE